MSGNGHFEEYNHFFTVQLGLFAGPIDLLLHLVKLRELPIEKVSLAEVATQYLECIEALREVDLDVAGEYLVIAATLLSIKSSVLLGDQTELVPDEDGNLIDPHEELLRRLRAAEVYKEGAEKLGRMDHFGQDVFAGPSVLHRFAPPAITKNGHDPMLLGKAFGKLLKQLDEPIPPYVVQLEAVSVVDRMMWIIDNLRQRGSQAMFEELIPDRTSRASVLASFVALLELCKRQVIQVRQEKQFDTIAIILSAGDTAELEFASEFDAAPQPTELTANA